MRPINSVSNGPSPSARSAFPFLATTLSPGPIMPVVARSNQRRGEHPIGDAAQRLMGRHGAGQRDLLAVELGLRLCAPLSAFLVFTFSQEAGEASADILPNHAPV